MDEEQWKSDETKQKKNQKQLDHKNVMNLRNFISKLKNKIKLKCFFFSTDFDSAGPIVMEYNLRMKFVQVKNTGFKYNIWPWNRLRRRRSRLNVIENTFAGIFSLSAFSLLLLLLF